jgi:SAM-dependent methyltransferase
VLDLGCGRGAVLTAVAKRLTTGTATGIDLWGAEHDQSGNAREATLANAEIEGVSARVRVETGDMRQLTFADASFDLVVSSLAIHNIPSRAGRAGDRRGIPRPQALKAKPRAPGRHLATAAACRAAESPDAWLHHVEVGG